MQDAELLRKLAKVPNVTVHEGMFGTIVQFWNPHPANAFSFMQRADGKWYHENGWGRQSHPTLKDVVQWVKANRPTPDHPTTPTQPQGGQ